MSSIVRILATPGNGYALFAVVTDELHGPEWSRFEGKEYRLDYTFITTAQTATALHCAVGLRVAGVTDIRTPGK